MDEKTQLSRDLLLFFGVKLTMGSLDYPHFRGINYQYKSMVSLRELSYNSALFGLVSYTWRIIPVSKWLVTPIYKPFRPFIRGITPFKGLPNHGY